MRKLPRNKKAVSSPSEFSRVDKFQIIVGLILLFVIPTLLWHFLCVHFQDVSVSKTMEKWKSIYHITDSQAERIKQIELDFHGSKSPFDIKGNRTSDEKYLHHEEISRLMSPEDGARFMKMMEKNSGRH